MERHIPVEGGTIWADDSGGGGTPVVLLHGGGTGSDIWLPLAAAVLR